MRFNRLMDRPPSRYSGIADIEVFIHLSRLIYLKAAEYLLSM